MAEVVKRVNRGEWAGISPADRERLEKKKRDGETLSDEDNARLAGDIKAELPERLKVKLQRDRENRIRLQEQNETAFASDADLKRDLTSDEVAKLAHYLRNKQPIPSDMSAWLLRFFGADDERGDGAREEDKISRVGRGRAGLDKKENSGKDVVKPRSAEEKAAEQTKKENEAEAARVAASGPASAAAVAAAKTAEVAAAAAASAAKNPPPSPPKK